MQLKAAFAMTAGLVMFGMAASDVSAERRDRDRRDNWTELGCQSVGFAVDRDVIKVGRREGRFRAIRLIAKGNRVQMISLRVVYSNGDPDDLPVRSELRPGVPTRAIDLRGRERAIQQIEMVYQAQRNFRGRATVCAEGLT